MAKVARKRTRKGAVGEASWAVRLACSAAAHDAEALYGLLESAGFTVQPRMSIVVKRSTDPPRDPHSDELPHRYRRSA